MSNRLVFETVLVLVGLAGCAAPMQAQPAPSTPTGTNAPAPTAEPYVPQAAVVGVVAGATEKVRVERDAKTVEVKKNAGSIIIDCSVKLPDDPTDNPELCRSFQMAMIDETGAEAARFRFGLDARYRFAGRAGKKYRVRPLIGKNWEFSIEPNRDLTIGERARVQLRQKE